MKKFAIFTLALGLLMLFAPIANASDTPSIEHYAVSNATGSDAISYVAVTTIIPGKHRLLGFLVSPITSASGSTLVGVYDAEVAGSITNANLLGEKGGVNTTSYELWFPRPIDVTNGVGVYLGAGSTVTLYYERSRP